MITPEQCRAARGWLDWTQQDLAQKANLSKLTVRRFETGQRIPLPNNLQAIWLAFAAAGIAPVNDENGRPLGLAFESVQQVDPPAPATS